MPQTLLFQPSQALQSSSRSTSATLSRSASRPGSNSDDAGENSPFRQTLDRATRRDEPAEQPAEPANAGKPSAKAGSSSAKSAKKTTRRNRDESEEATDSTRETKADNTHQVESKTAGRDAESEDHDSNDPHGEESAREKPDHPATDEATNRAAAEQSASQQQIQAKVAQRDPNKASTDQDRTESVQAADGHVTGSGVNLANASTATTGVVPKDAVDTTASASTEDSGSADGLPSPHAERSEPNSTQLRSVSATKAKATGRSMTGSRQFDQADDASATGQTKATGTGGQASPPSGSGDLIDSTFASALSEAIEGKNSKSAVDESDDASSNGQEDLASASHLSTNHSSEAKSTPEASSANDPRASSEARFAENNHEKVVTGMKAELLPNGGTMKLRLDPPELGTMQVSLHMRDGVVTASFQTSNDEATRLLSHSLGDLRSTLEANGMTVDKLQVQQAPKDESSRDASSRDLGGRPGQQATQDQEARREQQRKDLVQRLWDKLAGNDPLDMVA